MHLKRDDSHHHGPPVIPITFILEDPEGLTGTTQKEWQVLGGEHESLLEVAMDNGINIEHACGGVCACSTCHVYVLKGAELLSDQEEEEEDILDKAFDVKSTSRLACQSKVGTADLTIELTRESRTAWYDEHPEERAQLPPGTPR
jgi:2Fe-2S ferredoxin